MKVVKTVTLISLILLLFTFADAEQNKIAFSGRIYDENGAVVPGTRIIAINSKKERWQAISNEEGAFELNLLPDVYRIEIAGNGFKNLVVKKYKIVNSTFNKICNDFVLELAGIVTGYI